MKRIPVLLAVAIMALLAIAAGSKGSKAEQAMMKLEKEWIDALIKRDMATLERIEADDYIFIDPTGTTSTKEDDMKNVKSGDLKFDAVDILESKVRVYGKAAVVTGKLRMKGNYKSQDIGGDYSFTDVFVKNGRDWKAVSAQLTRVMAP